MNKENPTDTNAALEQNTVSEIQTKKPNKYPIIIISLLLLLVILCASIFLLFGRAYHKTKIYQNSNVPTEKILNIVPTREVNNTKVSWLQQPQQVASVGFFSLVDKYYPYQLTYLKDTDTNTETGIVKALYEPKATYYFEGTITNGEYNGGKIYLSIVRGLPNAHTYKSVPTAKDVVNDLDLAYLFIQMPDSSFIVSGDYNDTILFCKSLGCGWSEIGIKGVDPKTNIKYNNSLLLDSLGDSRGSLNPSDVEPTSVIRSNNFFNPSGLFLVEDLGNNTQLYSNQDIHNILLPLKVVVNPIFEIKLPTGLEADTQLNGYETDLAYQSKSDNSPHFDTNQIYWTAVDKPKPLPLMLPEKRLQTATDTNGIFYTTDYDGCWGTMTLANSSSDTETLDTSSNLEQVATTNNGEGIYEIKNKDYKMYQSFYSVKLQENGLENVLNYNDYLALKPILIWKNSLGIYRMVFRDDLVYSKCWGEPLIYLYPTKKESMSIKLSHSIAITQSEPLYNGSWNVAAYPDGRIYTNNRNQPYPYLYWEGNVPNVSNPVSAKVISKNNIHSYFENELTLLGLNSREKKDFENYWEPQLTDSPYYVISFYDATSLNKIAPLQINPTPTTLIRVLMSYEKLHSFINYSSGLNNYQTPQRKGFSVVEWGGILHNLPR